MSTSTGSGVSAARLGGLYERLATTLEVSAQLADDAAEREEKLGRSDRAEIEHDQAVRAREAAVRAREYARRRR